MKLRHRIKRLLGIVSPSGAYPLPPRWAMSKKGRADWYPPERVSWGQPARPQKPRPGVCTDACCPWVCGPSLTAERAANGAQAPCEGGCAC